MGSKTGSKTTSGWQGSAPCMLGIDEAGRGPVLGPMVYTAAYCPLSEKSALHALGADDSKQLSAEKRDGLRKKIDAAEFLGTRTAILSAEELSFKMLRRRKYNLNLISHDTALQLVHDCIEAGVNVTEVYVDTVGNPEQYARKFRDRFQHLEKVVVAKKADATYRIVGAASIVAKTTRDHQVHGWKFPEELRPGGITFSLETGSGYPSDPKCKAWMEGNVDSIFGYPSLVRFSWGTTRTVLERKAVAVDWEASDEEDEGKEAPGKAQAVSRRNNIANYYVAKPKRTRTGVAKRSQLLQSLGLKRVHTLF